MISTLVGNLALVAREMGGKSGDAVALLGQMTKLFQALRRRSPV